MLPPATLYELLAAQARSNPRATAILAPGRHPLSFGELLDQIHEVMGTLNGWGLGRGDRIALLAERGPEAAVATLAVSSCAVGAPLDMAGTAPELEQSLAQIRAKALLVPGRATAAVHDLCGRSRILLLEYATDASMPAGRFRLRGGRPGAVVQGGPATAADLAYVVRTSGTTGRAKIAPTSHSNIVARTEKGRRLFGLTPGDRCLNVMPLCYQHGLNGGLLVPLAAGGSTICPSVFDAPTFVACVRDFAPTWYTAGFTHHRAVVDWLTQRPRAIAGHRLRFVRSGSGPLAASLSAELERVFDTPVVETYSASEVGIISCTPLAGACKAGTVGTSLDDDVAIMGEDGSLLPPNAAGEIVVQGATVFGGYDYDPAVRHQVFHDGWFLTGDEGCMDAEGSITLLGRRDETINRGGVKIAPREVDDALLQHADVVQAMCFPVPHPTLHQELAAAVVLRADAQASEDDLRRFLQPHLAPSKIPRRIVRAEKLPQGPTGKFSRVQLAEHFGLNVEKLAATNTEPHTHIQQMLTMCWRQVLKRDDIGCDDDFFLLGGDSIMAVDLMLRIEEHLQYRLPPTVLAESPTIRKLEACLERATLGAINNTIRVNVGGTRRPLFALYGRYGHVLRWLPALRSLGCDQPCYGLQPPGMDWSSVGCTTVPEMAAHYLAEVKSAQPKGPYRLLGASFGGLVAFEMALRLQKGGESVEFLGIVDTNPSTCLFDGKADISDPLRLPEPEPENWIEDVNNKVAQAHLHARTLYLLDGASPTHRFRGEMTYFYCKGNPVVANDRRVLWRHFADQFRLLPLPGVHCAVHQEPQCAAIVALLRACLEGGSLPSCDPASVFERTYRLERHAPRETIVSSTGEIFNVHQNCLGRVEAYRTDAHIVRIEGWALDAFALRPYPTIAAFLDERFLGYGACGLARPDVVKSLADDSAQHAGFSFCFRADGARDAALPPRLFVLSPGDAAELRYTAA